MVKGSLEVITVPTEPSDSEEKQKDFLGSPGVRTLHSHCRGHRFIPHLGTEILPKSQNRTNKQKQEQRGD